MVHDGERLSFASLRVSDHVQSVTADCARSATGLVDATPSGGVDGWYRAGHV